MLKKLLAMTSSPAFPAVVFIAVGVELLTKWVAEGERRLDALNAAVLERLHALEEVNVAVDLAQHRFDNISLDLKAQAEGPAAYMGEEMTPAEPLP